MYVYLVNIYSELFKQIFIKNLVFFSATVSIVSEFRWGNIICTNIVRTQSLLCRGFHKGGALTLKWISLKCDDNPPSELGEPIFRGLWLHRGEHWRDGFSFRSIQTSTRLLANQKRFKGFPIVFTVKLLWRERYGTQYRAIGLGYAKLFASTWLDLHFQMQLD